MSLKHIMLGLLREPHSGYDIKKHFEQSLRNFWQAELSQIYPLLQKMEAEGLVRSRHGASDIGPTKRIYKRAQKGTKELHRWLEEGPIIGKDRISYLAQVYFLADLDDIDKAISYMKSLRDEITKKVAALEIIESNWRSNDTRYPNDLADEEFYPHLTLALGIKRLGATGEWCEDSLRKMQVRRRWTNAKRSQL